jgi:hypothetical protein
LTSRRGFSLSTFTDVKQFADLDGDDSTTLSMQLDPISEQSNEKSKRHD